MILIAFLCVTLSVLGLNLHRLQYGPLAHLPGPWHTRITNFRLKWATLSGRRMFYIHDLHQQYGPIVRIAPDEADICDAEGFKQIHAINSGFVKSDWYRVFSMLPRLVVFSMSDTAQHSDRRRLLSQPLSKSSLRRDWEATVREKIQMAVKGIVTEGQNGATVDVMKWWKFLATDIIAQLSFGESFGQIESGKPSAFVDALHTYQSGGILCAELPLIFKLGGSLPFGPIKNVRTASDIVLARAQTAVDNMKASASEKNIFAKVHNASKVDDASMGDEDVRSEAAALIIAGSDITAVALTFLTYMVLLNPKLQANLEAEVAALPAEYKEADLELLELLNAVINEILRIYNPAPSGLPRVVPAGGREICGFAIPSGCVVATQSYSLHRLPSVWPDAERFDPLRWREPLSEEARAVHNPWGAGTRTCIGQHLALMEMRLAVAEFFRVCKGARLVASATAESMVQINYFIAMPKDNRLEICLAQ